MATADPTAGLKAQLDKINAKKKQVNAARHAVLGFEVSIQDLLDTVKTAKDIPERDAAQRKYALEMTAFNAAIDAQTRDEKDLLALEEEQKTICLLYTSPSPRDS